jgi:Flp pilus assembly protein TadD
MSVNYNYFLEFGMASPELMELGMLSGNQWDLRLKLGIGYELHGEKEKALEEYRRALEMMLWKEPKWYFCTHAMERLKK